MMNNFTFNEKSSLDFGLMIQEKSVFSAPKRDVSKITVPGRNGDLKIDNGRFENIPVKYKCCIVDIYKNFDTLTRQIKSWLMSGGVGYFELTDTYNDGFFRLASYDSAVEISDYLKQAKTVEINFDCKPFLYSKTGQRKMKINQPTSIQNPYNIPSLPYIKIKGNGLIKLNINGKVYSFANVNEFVEVDSQLMNAFKGLELQNDKMAGDDFPTLVSGENKISWEGTVSALEIIPRWCCL